MEADDLLARVRDNVTAVRQRMSDAAQRSGRDCSAVRLVAVTKYVDTKTAALLLRADCRSWGESRPQDLWKKHGELPGLVGPQTAESVEWHLSGHLQRNKIARTLPLTTLLHSADSLRLLEAIQAEAAHIGRPAAVLLEVNISGDAAKHGFAAEHLPELFVSLAGLPNIEVRGLMAMSGLDSDAAAVRREFAALRELRDQLRQAWQGRFALDELSMGMSGDFEAAILEGATLVRIGSALFEGCL